MRLIRLLACALIATMLLPAPALAYPWKRAMKEGDRGGDVKALQIRVAGWFPRDDQTYFATDGRFGGTTIDAVRKFQKHYGLIPDGVAGPATLVVLDALQNPDGSTIHFDWKEFKQNRSSSCSAKANAYGGTFGGGMVPPRRVKMNVKRLMWRLEALRAKGENNPVGINSAFRSVTYNDCIGGARASQHLYGTAADNRMAEVDNRTERNLAKVSQFQGIGCYSSTTHNHFDLRIDNHKLASSRAWWWPQRDSKGRDLDATGRPCWGETRVARQSSSEGGSYRTTASVLTAIRSFVPGAGSWVPSPREIAAFEAAGELSDLNGAD